MKARKNKAWKINNWMFGLLAAVAIASQISYATRQVAPQSGPAIALRSLFFPPMA